MGRILLLSDEVASQVAAGEVVERPASIVKELVENSIDAQATRIEVAIARGGSSRVRVVDNGIGMDRDDALLSLERHATSKIRTGKDLARIFTLGFRGEALPSIASVSRFRLATRTPHAREGTEVLVNGGKIETVRSSGEAPGTLIEARSLFYNLPARRKFLRSEATETSHVQHQLVLQAIGHSKVGFVFLRDQHLVFQLPPAVTLADRIRDLRGAEFLRELIEMEVQEQNGIRLHGFIGRAGVSRATRSEQIVFVNGRPIENLAISHGLREGYHTALMRGRFPVTLLFLEIDPEQVDVNVHPSKREVRFRAADAVRDAVAESVSVTLAKDRSRWAHSFERPPTAEMPPEPVSQPDQALAVAPRGPDLLSAPLIPLVEQFALRRDWGMLKIDRPAAAPRPDAAVDHRDLSAPAVRQIDRFAFHGVLGKLYVLLENEEGLVLVDQHAAHERILFERLRSQMEVSGAPCQKLLIPVILQVAPRDHDWLIANAETLQRMGFLIESFGELTLKIDGIPPFFRTDDPAAAIRLLVDELRSAASNASAWRMGEELIAKTVCRHAIKANDALHDAEIGRLIEDLLSCNLPYCCPHGRPTMIQIGYGELEKKFGRKV